MAFGVDNTGRDTIIHQDLFQHPDRQCSVFLYLDAMGEEDRIESVGFTVTTGGDLSYANISAYDVVIIPLVGPGVIGGFQSDLETFVSGGGGLWIHQPNAVGAIDYAPAGFEFSVFDYFWCEPPDANVIVDAAHPTMAGLSNVDLPGRFDRVSVGALGSGYGLVAQADTICYDDIHCAAGCFGAGRVFTDLANLSPFAIDPGSDSYIVNVIEWLCEGEPSPADETTWGAVKNAFSK
jgi:hypothetical protein